MHQRHHVCALGVVELEQLRLGVGRDQLKRLTNIWAGLIQHNAAALVDPNAQMAELEHVGLLVVELKRDQSGRAVALGAADEHSTRAVFDAAIRHNDEIAAQAQAGLITGQVNAGIKGRGQFARGE